MKKSKFVSGVCGANSRAKRRSLLAGILSIALVFGLVASTSLTLAGCDLDSLIDKINEDDDDDNNSGNNNGNNSDNNGNPGITFTGIDSQYNGQYVIFRSSSSTPPTGGGDTLIGGSPTSSAIIGVPISGGSVTIPVYLASSTGTLIGPYTGSDKSIKIYLSIKDSQSFTFDELGNKTHVKYTFDSVNFTNGSTSVNAGGGTNNGNGANNGNNNGGGGNNNPGITFTGIGSQYNGQYAIFRSSSSTPPTGGGDTLIGGSPTSSAITGVQISGGSVTIPVSLVNSATGTLIGPYTGSDKSIKIYLSIKDSQSFTFDELGNKTHVKYTFDSVNFTNGSASVNAGDGPDDGNIVEIDTLAKLMSIGANAESMSGNYRLTADITGVTAPIGSVSESMPMPFTGDFDGNGHTVTLNITKGLTVPSGDFAGTFAGLFAALGEMTGSPGTSGLVHDLTVAGTINITSAALCAAGGVAGVALPTAGISNVASSVNVTAGGSGDVFAGGILGISQSTVRNVYATGAVSATTTGTKSAYAGGIAGTTFGELIYAYATGTVSAQGTGIGKGTNYGTDDEKVTVGAGGIAGAATSATVRYTVALNPSVSVINSSSYNTCSFRITSTSGGTVIVNGAANYGKADLTPTGAYHMNDKGSNQQDGVDVTVTGGPLPAAYTAPGETWWRSTGWAGSDWTTVWEWDAATGLPKLR